MVSIQSGIDSCWSPDTCKWSRNALKAIHTCVCIVYVGSTQIRVRSTLPIPFEKYYYRIVLSTLPLLFMYIWHVALSLFLILVLVESVFILDPFFSKIIAVCMDLHNKVRSHVACCRLAGYIFLQSRITELRSVLIWLTVHSGADSKALMYYDKNNRNRWIPGLDYSALNEWESIPWFSHA